MSLVSYTVRCDWPGCLSAVTVTVHRHGSLLDQYWMSRGMDIYGHHLCPQHRFKTWVELDVAVSEALTTKP